MVFSDSINNTGLVQQTRDFMRVDATQWPTARIVNSANNYLDMLAGYAIATDRRFNWDDTNHSKLPIGTTPIVPNQSDYSFLTDEQGNRILTLTRIEFIDAQGNETTLTEIDEDSETKSISDIETGIPTGYYKIADNIVRLNLKPTSGSLRFYFQRTPSYFTASDTTKEPGVAATLHRGFVIACAYDGALALGLPNLQPLSVEMQKETQKMVQYFSSRNNDIKSRMTVRQESTR